MIIGNAAVNNDQNSRIGRFFRHLARARIRRRLGCLRLGFGLMLTDRVEVVHRCNGAGTVEQQARFKCEGAAGGAERGAVFLLHGQIFQKGGYCENFRIFLL